jgi:hypothetical protein
MLWFLHGHVQGGEAHFVSFAFPNVDDANIHAVGLFR